MHSSSAPLLMHIQYWWKAWQTMSREKRKKRTSPTPPPLFQLIWLLLANTLYYLTLKNQSCRDSWYFWYFWYGKLWNLQTNLKVRKWDSQKIQCLKVEKNILRLKSLFGPTTCDLSHHDTDDEFSFRHLWKFLKVWPFMFRFTSAFSRCNFDNASTKLIWKVCHILIPSIPRFNFNILFTVWKTGQQQKFKRRLYIGSRVKGLKYLGHNLRQVLNKKEKSFLTLKLVLFLWERILDTKLWHNK